jgi:glycosyltransferase involved in cell wall biosynthesis
MNRNSLPPRRRDTALVVPVFPERVKNFARALEEAGRLRAVIAAYVYEPARMLERACQIGDRVLGTRVTDFLRRRELPGVRPERCHSTVMTEAIAHVRRQPIAHLLGWEDPYSKWHHERIDRFAASRVIDKQTAWVFGRDGAALLSFLRAKQIGARTLYDLPTPHHETVHRIMEREEAQFPDVCQLPKSTADFTPARNAYKQAELQAADHVIVGSAFVRDSLTRAGLSSDAITVLPSACQASWVLTPENALPRNVVLHVGRLGLRKGTHRLLRAWKKLGAYRHHSLRLIGDMNLTPLFLRDFEGCYDHIPRLPKDSLKREYSAASMFVLPAAAEGFAGVILEALSCAVPILASRNSGAEGFLEHGRHGLLHEFGNDDELCSHLDWMLSHPRERVEMSRAAREMAQSWTWSHYRQRFLEILSDLDRRLSTPTPFARRRIRELPTSIV